MNFSRQRQTNPVDVTLTQIFISFFKLGAVSFGGSAMVAYIKRLAVTQKKWVTEDDFLKGVALCQALPGATAMQCAAWTGLRTKGLKGAVAAYIGFGGQSNHYNSCISSMRH
jgi:chromate transporter